MGAYLDSPIKDKNPEFGSYDNIHWGACAMQGWRCGMEDAHINFKVKGDTNDALVFGVFDGHGGKEVAVFCKENIQAMFEKQLEAAKGDYKEALRRTVHELDTKVREEDYADSTGTTSCVVLITNSHIYCANSGDSRAVLNQNGKAIALSEDHKPQNPDELRRIEASGHMVEDDRVDGNLALSRAIGDWNYKDKNNLTAEQQAVTCDPDISERERQQNEDEFLIIACDGIWDCKTNEQCVKFLCEKIKPNMRPHEICEPVEKLLDDCCAADTDNGIGTDNMTAILVQFGKE